MSAQTAFDVATEVGFWRERAELAEGRLDEAVGRLAGAEARILELAEQVAVLSRMLFGRSSEKTSPGGSGDRVGGDGLADPTAPPSPSGADGDEPAGDEPAGRGQRRGSKGHGRRDYSRLQTREEIHDVADGQRVCLGCGQQFEFLGSECSEQIDWQVSITGDRAPQAAVPASLSVPGPAYGDRAPSAESGPQRPVHAHVFGPAAVPEVCSGSAGAPDRQGVGR